MTKTIERATIAAALAVLAHATFETITALQSCGAC